MSIEITGINHGLSVHTTADGTIGADTIDNRRLRWPVPQEGSIIVYNTFNDATSGDFYKYPAGHEGIDFLCADTAVEAMYGGVVTEIKRDWEVGSEEGLSNYVTIRSCTDPATGTGFEHTYAHLQSTEENIKGEPDGQGRSRG